MFRSISKYSRLSHKNSEAKNYQIVFVQFESFCWKHFFWPLSVFEYAWSVEPDLYIAEGPTLDNEGNLYFSPFSPKENISLVSLDAITGERRWIIEDPIEGGGAPLILNGISFFVITCNNSI